MTDSSAAMLAEAKSQLAMAVADIESGLDVPPAQRLSLEWLLSLALQGGAKSEEFDLILRGHGSLRIVSGETRPRVELQLWQKRAPVVPTTKD